MATNLLKQVRKRDGQIESFDINKIGNAILKAMTALDEKDKTKAQSLAEEVAKILEKRFKKHIPNVEEIQDTVEEVLMQKKLVNIAKAYILYRAKHAQLREHKKFFGVTDDLKLGINAIKVLERRYLLRDKKGNVKETPSELFRRVAQTVAEVEKKYGVSSKQVKNWEERFYSLMVGREFLPNTPCLINAGARLKQLSACFVVDIQDSVDSIFKALSITAKIHQTGGGTGFSFSKIRPKGDIVNSTGGKASGPVSFMKIFDEMTNTMKQGGVRRGANMAVLRVDHPDILEFVTMKADESVMKNFNVSVAVTDAFMKAVQGNKEYDLINPHNGKKVKRLSAREVFNIITTYAWRTGDPGMIFVDEINRKNPTKHLGDIEATNPCGEVPLHPWESCNLASINLSKFVDGELTKGKINWETLREAVRDGVRFLDNMIDISKFPAKEIEKAVYNNRRVGLGVMGFAEALILLGIPYNSQKALEIAEKIAKFIEKESLEMSSELGKKRGSFPNFKGSLWYKKGHKKGYKNMRNATTTVIAPTGTISIIAGCSSGIEPLFAVTFVRNVMEGKKLIESNRIFEKISEKGGFYSQDLLIQISKNRFCARSK